MLDQVQTRTYDFLESANRVLPDELSMFYGGSFLTGNTQAPECLFLGINPGYGGWKTRPRTFARKPYTESPCKFLEEADDGARLAERLVEIVLEGDASRLASCAETSVRSFFATPDVKILDQQMNALRPSGLAQAHDELMRESVPCILDVLRPKQIVCIGMTTFQTLINLVGDKDQAIEMKSERSASGKSDPVFHKKTTLRGIPVHGVLHLSGAYLSNKMIESLKTIFATEQSAAPDDAVLETRSLDPVETELEAAFEWSLGRYDRTYEDLAK